MGSKIQSTQPLLLNDCSSCLGEALRVLRLRDAQLSDRFTDLPQIISLRNLVAHIYWHVNRNDLWQIITTDLRPFREQIAKELALLTPPV